MLIRLFFVLFLCSCVKEKHFFVSCVEGSNKKIDIKDRFEKCLYLYDAGEDRELTKVLNLEKVNKWVIKK